MLFDDNLGFFGFTIPKEAVIKEKSDLASIEKGFSRGNMFNDLYDEYKDYKVVVPVATTERESDLLDIMALSLALNDLNLYLDLHPGDKEMLKKFNELVEVSCTKEMEFVKKYGPLEVNDGAYYEKFEWINNPWPWENEMSSKYV